MTARPLESRKGLRDTGHVRDPLYERAGRAQPSSASADASSKADGGPLRMSRRTGLGGGRAGRAAREPMAMHHRRRTGAGHTLPAVVGSRDPCPGLATASAAQQLDALSACAARLARPNRPAMILGRGTRAPSLRQAQHTRQRLSSAVCSCRLAKSPAFLPRFRGAESSKPLDCMPAR